MTTRRKLLTGTAALFVAPVVAAIAKASTGGTALVGAIDSGMFANFPGTVAAPSSAIPCCGGGFPHSRARLRVGDRMTFRHRISDQESAVVVAIREHGYPYRVVFDDPELNAVERWALGCSFNHRHIDNLAMQRAWDAADAALRAWHQGGPEPDFGRLCNNIELANLVWRPNG